MPLTAESTAGYLSVRLRQAGGQGKPLFDKSAVEALHSSSGGIPRLVNLIASRSLMAGYLEKETAIGKKQVEIAAKEVLRQEHGGKNKKSGTGRVVLIATAITATLLTATLAAWIFSKPGNFISIINSSK